MFDINAGDLKTIEIGIQENIFISYVFKFPVFSRFRRGYCDIKS